MLKGLIFAIFILVLTLGNRSPTLRQLYFLFGAGLISLLVSCILAKAIDHNFTEILLLQDEWLYAQFSVVAAYTFLVSAVIATTRYYINRKKG